MKPAQNSAPFSHCECRRCFGGPLVAGSCQQRLAGIVTAYVCCPETAMPVPYCCTSLPDANEVQNSALFFADSLLPCALLAVVDRRWVDMSAATIFGRLGCAQNAAASCLRACTHRRLCLCLDVRMHYVQCISTCFRSPSTSSRSMLYSELLSTTTSVKLRARTKRKPCDRVIWSWQ